MIIKTDNYPSENWFSLESADAMTCVDAVHGSLSSGSYGGYGGGGCVGSTTYGIEIHMALCEGYEYTFTMHDDYCDGICCGTC